MCYSFLDLGKEEDFIIFEEFGDSYSVNKKFFLQFESYNKPVGNFVAVSSKVELLRGGFTLVCCFLFCISDLLLVLILQIDSYILPFIKPRKQLMAISRFVAKNLETATGTVLQEFCVHFLSKHADAIKNYYTDTSLGHFFSSLFHNSMDFLFFSYSCLIRHLNTN